MRLRIGVLPPDRDVDALQSFDYARIDERKTTPLHCLAAYPGRCAAARGLRAITRRRCARRQQRLAPANAPVSVIARPLVRPALCTNTFIARDLDHTDHNTAMA